jgi:hypothetical protein
MTVIRRLPKQPRQIRRVELTLHRGPGRRTVINKNVEPSPYAMYRGSFPNRLIRNLASNEIWSGEGGTIKSDKASVGFHPKTGTLKVEYFNPTLLQPPTFDRLNTPEFGEPFFRLPEEHTDRAVMDNILYTIGIPSSMDSGPRQPATQLGKLIIATPKITPIDPDEVDHYINHDGLDPQAHAIRIFGQFENRPQQEELYRLLATTAEPFNSQYRPVVNIPYWEGNPAFTGAGLLKPTLSSIMDHPELQRILYLGQNPLVYSSTGFSHQGSKSFEKPGWARPLNHEEASEQAGLREF